MSGARDSVKIFANIFISFIGAGVLGLPYAFKKAGLLEGILVMSLVSYFSVKAMLLLIDCKYKVLNILNSGPENGRKRSLSRGEKTKTLDGNSYVELKCSDVDEDDVKGEKNNNRSRHVSSSRVSSAEISYSDIGFSALGMPGRTLVDFSLLLSQIGFCCAYLIFITENLSSFIPSVDKNQWLAMLLPPLFILTLIKDLSKFALFSLFAQVSNLFAFTIVYWFDFQHLHLAQVDPKEFSLEGFPYFFSVAIYCYEGAGMILSLESSVAEDLRDKFKQFFIRTIIVITTLYITFGAAGYLSYGNDTRDIITLNLPNTGGLNSSLIVKSCLCISLFFTYPVMLFPVFSILKRKLDMDSLPFFIGLRFFIVCLTGIIVIKVPNFGELMALVGASSCTLLAFILPAVCHLIIFRSELSSYDKVFNYTLIVLGISGAVVGTVDTLLNAKH